ncbi:MAG: DUF3179 domain-containing (seleno)protein, partial [Rhodospirillaceae bacterium]
MTTLRALVLALALAAALARPAKAADYAADTAAVIKDNWTLLFGSPYEKKLAAGRMAARGKDDVVPLAILAMRYDERSRDAYDELIGTLTGFRPKTWHEAATWLETHPEVKPHESFRTLKLLSLARLDPKFLQFLGGSRSDPDKLRIRLEEVAWGGVTVDGIPSLDDPNLIPAAEADYLIDTDEVFGIAINGDVRAYPLRIMGWHDGRQAMDFTVN